MSKEKILRKKIREREDATGLLLENLERELLPLDQEIKPITARKKKK